MELPVLVDHWILDRRVRSRCGLFANTERAYRNDLAGFANRVKPVPAGTEPDPDDPWGRQNMALTNIGLDAFTDTQLKTVFAAMIDDNITPATRGRLLPTLRGFCRWAEDNGHLDEDPTRRFETPTK